MSSQNTSATGGYLLPQDPAPTQLSFKEFLQTVMVGVSGLPGSLVRPKWQLNPPKQPDVCVDWMAFGISEDVSDTFAYTALDSDGDYQLMRMEELTVQCSFYGPNSYEVCKILRDGFQLGQNREALSEALMTFAYSDRMVQVPDLVNERWVDRWEMAVYLRREILRTYPVLNFVSGAGIVKVNNQGSDVKTIPIVVNG